MIWRGLRYFRETVYCVCDLIESSVYLHENLIKCIYVRCLDYLSFLRNKHEMRHATFLLSNTENFVNKLQLLLWTIVSEATTGSFFAIKSWFPVRPSQRVNFSSKKPKIATLIAKELPKFITFYYFYCKKLARNL